MLVEKPRHADNIRENGAYHVLCYRRYHYNLYLVIILLCIVISSDILYLYYSIKA